MSRRPTTTSLLNGQAVKTAFGSISNRSMLELMRRRRRAAVAAAKPPPTTMTRGAVCARAIRGVARTAPATKVRRPSRGKEKGPPPPLAGVGWGEGAAPARLRPPPPNPLPQGEGELLLEAVTAA